MTNTEYHAQQHFQMAQQWLQLARYASFRHWPHYTRLYVDLARDRVRAGRIVRRYV